MPIIRVEKANNYTVMSNTHLKDRKLSLAAKGLLSVALSLPDNWGYSLSGLIAISKEKETAVKTALKDLKNNGYLTIRKYKGDKGLFEYEYIFREEPIHPEAEVPPLEVPPLEVPGLEVPGLENQPLLNTNILNTNILNTKGVNTKRVNTPAEKPREVKHKYGEYKHVSLKDSEYEKLAEDLGEPMRDDCIKFLDEYIEMKGYKAKNHNLCIRKWVIDAVKERQRKNKPTNQGNRLDWIDNVEL